MYQIFDNQDEIVKCFLKIELDIKFYLRIQKEGEYPVQQNCFRQLLMKQPPTPFAKQCMDV